MVSVRGINQDKELSVGVCVVVVLGFGHVRVLGWVLPG